MKTYLVLLLLSFLAGSLAASLGERRIARAVIRTPKFTRQRILSMIDGMDNSNKTYNIHGDEAGPDDTHLLTRKQLDILLQHTEPARTAEFRKQKILDMIEGMDVHNKTYNYEGDVAGPNDLYVLTRDQLDILMTPFVK